MIEELKLDTPYTLIKNFIRPEAIELLIQQALAFKTANYTEENLASHAAYLSDVQPHRTSSAFAVADYRTIGDFLPTISLENNLTCGPELRDISWVVSYKYLELRSMNRMLFNIQEYFSASERVPKHNDGELLEFIADKDGNLDIRRSIRPEKVAVLTLVNDTTNGGTRLHFDDGREELVRGEAGDLLVFDNLVCMHSVDPLEGVSKREDGLLRMIIGWRSLGDRCAYAEGDKNSMVIAKISREKAEAITTAWYKLEWPAQWEAIKASRQKAAF
jgi:hypothetical protein